MCFLLGQARWCAPSHSWLPRDSLSTDYAPHPARGLYNVQDGTQTAHCNKPLPSSDKHAGSGEEINFPMKLSLNWLLTAPMRQLIHLSFLFLYTTTNTVTPLWWVRRDLKVSASPVTTSATTGHLLSLRKARGHTRARGRSKSCPTARKQHRRACKHPACCNHSGLERGKFCTGRHKVQKQYPESWRAPGSA